MRRRLASRENDASFSHWKTRWCLIIPLEDEVLPRSRAGVPPGSGRSVYRYPVGPIRTARIDQNGETWSRFDLPICTGTGRYAQW
ncbi:hypothetical protein B296_00054269, partial [Ensete ventricosum]